VGAGVAVAPAVAGAGDFSCCGWGRIWETFLVLWPGGLAEKNVWAWGVEIEGSAGEGDDSVEIDIEDGKMGGF
jgi:hypothetical protein